MQYSRAADRSAANRALGVMRYFTLAAFLGVVLLPTVSCAKAARQRAEKKAGSAATPATPTAAASLTTKRTVARMLVRKVRLDLAVGKVGPARSQVERIAQEAGGYVHAAAYEARNKRRHWNATLKVPPAALSKVLVALRELGSVQHESLTTEEVTAAVLDVRARLKTLRTAETRLQQIALQKTASVKDLLAVEKELTRLRSQIEKLEATERHYIGAVGLATITVTLNARLVTAAKPGAWAKISGAFTSGLGHLRDFLVFVAVAVGHLWSLLLLLLAIAVVLYRLRRLLGKGFVALFGVKPAPSRPVYASSGAGAGVADAYRGHYGYVDPRAYGGPAPQPHGTDHAPAGPPAQESAAESGAADAPDSFVPEDD